MHIRKYLAFLDAEKLQTVQDVERALIRLDRILGRSELKALRNFNVTYWVITKNVRQAVAKGVFDYPEFLRKFDTRFAAYYFDALRSYLEHKPTAAAWQEAFDLARSGRLSPLITMSLGVNAHVNNDIPQVLIDCRADERYRDDYNRINKVIRDSIYEVIDRIDRSQSVFRPDRALLRPLFKLAMSLVIPRWRGRAWKACTKLAGGTIILQDIEAGALLMRRELTKLPV